MRHRKAKRKLGRDSSHRRCLMANLLKSLIIHGQIVTTVAKAKFLQPYADRMVTIAKKGTLASRRHAIAKLMVRFNKLTPKQARLAREGDRSHFNGDRQVIGRLDELAKKFSNRFGGYTRLIKHARRVGDNAQTCLVQYVDGQK